jgi:hypothetical protein
MLYETLQKLLRAGELKSPDLNDSNRRLFNVPSQTVVREAFMADRQTIPDSYQGETVRFWPVEGK